MKVVIYARYSSDRQRDASIDQQIHACRLFAERQGYTIVDVYTDRALSARTDQRPAFQQMINDASSHQFEAILVYTLDRFSRDRYDSAVYKHKLKQLGIRVLSAMENISDDPTGILLESMLEGLAEYYSAELSRKIHRGLEDNARKFLATGSVPFGYDRSPDGHYVINEDEATIVREIFEMMKDGTSIKRIIDDLNDRGIRTKTGREWTFSSFNSLLTNQRYIGTYIWKGHRTPNVLPPILSKEVFTFVQDNLKNKQRPRGTGRRTELGIYLLTGRTYCATCGEPVVGSAGTGKSGKVYCYYQCKHNNCLRVARDTLEQKIARALYDVVMDDDCIRWMAHNAAQEELSESGASELVLVKSQLEQVQREKKNIMKAILAGIINDTTKQMLDDIESREHDLSIRAEALKESMDRRITEDDILSYLQLFRDGDIEDKNMQQGIIDGFVVRVDLSKDNARVVFRCKKENRTADVPLSGGECSSDSPWWSLRESIRTLYYIDGYYVMNIPA